MPTATPTVMTRPTSISTRSISTTRVVAMNRFELWLAFVDLCASNLYRVLSLPASIHYDIVCESGSFVQELRENLRSVAPPTNGLPQLGTDRGIGNRSSSYTSPLSKKSHFAPRVSKILIFWGVARVSNMFNFYFCCAVTYFWGVVKYVLGPRKWGWLVAPDRNFPFL